MNDTKDRTPEEVADRIVVRWITNYTRLEADCPAHRAVRAEIAAAIRNSRTMEETER